jgi:thiazole synthase
LGCDAVLLNSAVSRSHNPIRMAHAVGLAAQAGRDAFLAGRMPQKFLAESASPLEGRAWR